LPGVTATVDAIAVWQHKSADSWDIYYSLWDHDAKQWYLPSGGKSAPIAVDAGDDHDPDVSSNDKTAIAVWAKDGKGIYYSKWQNFVWTVPAAISDDRADSDPTVAVDPNGNALAVWVTGKTSLYFSYYKSNIGWTTPEKVKLEGLSVVSLPELAYSPDKGYYLVFTGTDYSGNNNAYGMVYSTTTGWSPAISLGSDAQVDNNMPTDQRTGVSAAETTPEVTMVWPGSTKVYATKFASNGSSFDTGEMPDAAYDSSEKANGAFTQRDDLYHQPDVNSPTSTNVISSLKQSDDRASLTFIRDRRVGLVVWWTEVLGPGEIYYSYYEGGAWLGVSQVDSALASAEDRNPAVTPMRKFLPFEETGEPFCGDTVIQAPEQCEVGIACPNPNDKCIIPPCICKPPPKNETLDCSANTFIPNPFGITLFRPGMICKDDCVAAFGKDWKCDIKTCVCDKKVPPPKNVSCAVNTQGMAAGAASKFKAGLLCKDDCKTLGKDYVCDKKTCICDKVPVKDLSCTKNTQGMATGLASQFKPGMLCQDDCKNNLGNSYFCDAVSCVCKKQVDEDYYCAGNTFGASLTGVNTYNPFLDICRDNCDVLGDDYTCNKVTCLCEQEEKKEVSCSGRKLESVISSNFGGPGPTPFNPATMTCKDDCDPSYYCDSVSCQCEPREVRNCVEGNSEDIFPDIETIGSELISLDLTGTGSTGPVTVGGAGTSGGGSSGTVETEIVSMDLTGEGLTGPVTVGRSDTSDGASTGTFDTEIVALDLVGSGPLGPVTTSSPDSFFDVFVEVDLPGDSGFTVDSFFDIFFEVELPSDEPTSSPDSFFDVFTELDIPTKQSFKPSTMICKDNCEVLGPEYECDMKACKCDYKPKEDFSCYSNTLSGFLLELGGNASGGFNPSAHLCKDDCEQAAAIVGGEWECNMKTCVCQPKPTYCKENTFEQIVEGSTGYSWLIGQCVDNCDKLGEGYTCDPFACVCRKKPDDKVYCDANTIDAYVEDTFGRAQTSRFDPSTQQCIDNCEERYGSDTVCDPVSCYCVPKENVEVACAAHTDHVSVTDVNKFDASSMQCKDDCKENWGSEYFCNLQSCTCSKSKPPEELPCSTRQAGKTTTVSAVGKICKDDCAETLGSEWHCVIDGCYCEKVEESIVESCADRSELEYIGDIGSNQCIDDCEAKYGADSICDPQSCTCSVSLEFLTCAGNTGSDVNPDTAYPQGWACLDNCDTLGTGYECDMEACQCKEPGTCGDGALGYPTSALSLRVRYTSTAQTNASARP
jgi:hypothetical protein